jgi:hypothetical protein
VALAGVAVLWHYVLVPRRRWTAGIALAPAD